METSSVTYYPQLSALLPDGCLRIPVIERTESRPEKPYFRTIGPDFPLYALWLRLREEECADADLFDGFGNGSLHIHIGLYPYALPRYLELDFHPADWIALFVKTLGVPTHVPEREGETVEEGHERSRRQFQEALPDYPLLSRIFDMYEDAVFTPDEVPTLQKECDQVKAAATRWDGMRALRKLLFACDDAIKNQGHLLLQCD